MLGLDGITHCTETFKNVLLILSARPNKSIESGHSHLLLICLVTHSWLQMQQVNQRQRQRRHRYADFAAAIVIFQVELCVMVQDGESQSAAWAKALETVKKTQGKPRLSCPVLAGVNLRPDAMVITLSGLSAASCSKIGLSLCLASLPSCLIVG